MKTSLREELELSNRSVDYWKENSRKVEKELIILKSEFEKSDSIWREQLDQKDMEVARLLEIIRWQISPVTAGLRHV